MVDGFLRKDKGAMVLLIDDVLARGDSKLETLENLKKEGAMVLNIVVLMDYEIGGKEILEQNGYQVHSSFTAKQLLHYLYLAGKISIHKYRKTLQGLLEIRDFFEQIDRA